VCRHPAFDVVGRVLLGGEDYGEEHEKADRVAVVEAVGELVIG